MSDEDKSEKSFTPAELRAGVKLQAGPPEVTIDVTGRSGRAGGSAKKKRRARRSNDDSDTPASKPGSNGESGGGEATDTSKSGGSASDDGDDSAPVNAISAAIKAIGDVPLANHPVRILDAETGEQVGGILMTDDDGIVRATVPEQKEYRIEIVEKDAAGADAVLLCRFVDVVGDPLVGETVAVTAVEAESGNPGESTSDEGDATTDANGMVERSAKLGAYRLEIRDQTFLAHAVLSSDKDNPDSVSLFVLAGTSQAPADDEEGDEPSDPELGSPAITMDSAGADEDEESNDYTHSLDDLHFDHDLESDVESDAQGDETSPDQQAQPDAGTDEET